LTDAVQTRSVAPHATDCSPFQVALSDVWPVVPDDDYNIYIKPRHTTSRAAVAWHPDENMLVYLGENREFS
jgi:hypothetical protein